MARYTLPMERLWRHDGVLEYESLDGFSIRMVRKENRLDVDCTRDGVTIGVGMHIDPDLPQDLHFPIEQFEASAVKVWKALQNMRAVRRGEPRPFPWPEEPPLKRKKKGDSG